MAVAVKTSPEASSPGALDRLPVLSLVGVVYVVGCLGVVFGAIPKLWAQVWPASFASSTVLALAMTAAAIALIVLGARLIGPKAVPGLKAGIFVGLVGLLVILLVTRWVGGWIEAGVYDNHWFGDSGRTVGIAVVSAVGVILLGIGIRLFARPATERWLVSFEHQGWFDAAAYKRLQGLRVRRGTILGILLVAGAGIYTLIGHGVLRRGSPNWELAVPFTGKVTIDKAYPANKEGKRIEGYSVRLDPLAAVKENKVYQIVDKDGNPVPDGKVVDPAGDARPILDQKWPGAGDPLTGSPVELSRFELRNINDEVSPKHQVKLVYANDATSLKGMEGKLIPKTQFDEVVQELTRKFLDEHKDLDSETLRKERERFERESLPKAVAPTPAAGPVAYAALPLLPSVQYTVPVLLMALALWLAWRVVNLPAFADFLIATEAELNKVSWTTGRRLRQDTIVVLVTVILMAVYLFGMDQVWRWLLSRDLIGTLQIQKSQSEVDKSVEQKPW
jgi:preprotein translocase SecE subunit